MSFFSLNMHFLSAKWLKSKTNVDLQYFRYLQGFNFDFISNLNRVNSKVLLYRRRDDNTRQAATAFDASHIKRIQLS